MCWLVCIMNTQVSRHDIYVSDSNKINQSCEDFIKIWWYSMVHSTYPTDITVSSKTIAEITDAINRMLNPGSAEEH